MTLPKETMTTFVHRPRSSILTTGVLDNSHFPLPLPLVDGRNNIYITFLCHIDGTYEITPLSSLNLVLKLFSFKLAQLVNNIPASNSMTQLSAVWPGVSRFQFNIPIVM